MHSYFNEDTPIMFRSIFAILSLALILGGCAKQPGKLGSAERPLTMAFVASVESQKLLVSGDKLAELLSKETGFKFKTAVLTSYAAAIEAMGAGKADIVWFPPFSYVLAHDKVGARVLLMTVRNGSKSYHGYIVVRKDSGIKTLADLKGKRFAFVDPLSTSGAVYPKLLLKENGYDPETFFSKAVYAGGHDKAVIAVYNKQVDGCAIYGKGDTDARDQVMSTIKDIKEKTVVIAKTEPIPNDTVAASKDLPTDIAERIKSGLLAVAKSDEGRRTALELYGIDGLVPAQDSDFDPIRRAVKLLGIDLEEAAKRD